MKILSNPYRLLAVIFALSALIFSCKKEVSSDLPPQDEEQANVIATQSDAEAESVFDGIFNDALGVNGDVGIGSTGIFGRASASNYGTSDINERVDNVSQLPPCLNVSIDHLSNLPFPLKITLDFGSTGCAANDGHWRKGKIIITYSGRLLVPGSSATTKFEGFSIDSITVDNSTVHAIANTGTVDKPQFTVEVSAKLTKPNGNYSEWHSRKVITWIEGYATTASRLDDMLKIEGDASGKVKRNDIIVAWKAVITKALIKKFACRWISGGEVRTYRETVSSNSPWVGILDYGWPNGGNCDNRALLTINNVPHEITLR